MPFYSFSELEVMSQAPFFNMCVVWGSVCDFCWFVYHSRYRLL